MVKLKICFALLCFATGFFSSLLSHETNFGISPSTLHEGGMHLETNVIMSDRPDLYQGNSKTHGRQRRRQEALRNVTIFHYGFTPEFTMGIAAPVEELESTVDGVSKKSSGLETVAIEAKYRFFKTDSFAGTTYASIISIYEFGGAKTDNPALHSGNDSLLLGLGVSIVRPNFSYWVNGAMRFHNEESGLKPGNEVIGSAAMGYRPWIAEEDEIEVNYLAEINYENQERGRGLYGEIGSSGRELLFLTPGIRFNYNRQLIKFAVQLPVYQKWHGQQLGFKYRAKVGWEWMY